MIKKEFILIRVCLLLFFLALSQSAFAVQFGDVIGTYRGQPIHSNYQAQDGLRTKWGVKWQCVEFVNRFYNQAMGMPNWVWTGNAGDYWENKKAVLQRFPNGGSVPPQVDDILVWGSGPGRHYGHVAIISAVSEQSVTVAEQNWHAAQAFRTLSRRGTTISGEGILGWMRKRE